LRIGQRNLFESFAGGESAPVRESAVEALPEVELWPEPEKLKHEKEVLDFYYSSHPLAQMENDIRPYAQHTVEQMKTQPGASRVTVGGMLTQVRVMAYKKPQRNGNTRYGRCKVEDFTGTLECLMWGDEFNLFKEAFKEDMPVIVWGNLEKK